MSAERLCRNTGDALQKHRRRSAETPETLCRNTGDALQKHGVRPRVAMLTSPTSENSLSSGMDHLNSTHLSANRSDYSSVFTNHVLPPLYFMIFVFGVFLNGLAAWIFFRVPSDSGLVVYLKNMVVADILMLSTFPFRLAEKLGLGGWHIHLITCRYTAVLFYFSMYVGILIIGLISLERYVRIVRHTSSSSTSPMGGAGVLQLLQSVRFARVLAVLAWSLLLINVLPNCLLTSRPANAENARDCMGLKTELGVRWHGASIFVSITIFWLTLLVVTFCYTSIACRVYQSYRRVNRNNSDARRKSNRSIFSILAVFFICFVPYHVCRVPYTLSQTVQSRFSQNTHFLLFQLKAGTLFLSAFNVCLDPVVYFLMCQTFRESLLRKLSQMSSRRSLTTAQSLSNI